MTTDADARREEVLAALVEAPGGVSGQDLADRLGCSRAAVHRHVEALRRAGVAVDGAHEGYVLLPGADPVSGLAATRALDGTGAGPVRWLAETGSTNDDAVAAARDGAPEGLVIGAEHQTRGRGRRGRDWRANPGDALLFSVLLRPGGDIETAGALPVLAAVAVTDALGPGAGVIWPNDVVVNGRKVCGILCEMGADESGVDWVVAGIGINVRGVPALGDARWTPGSVADAGAAPRRHDLLVAVLGALWARYRAWAADGAADALAAFASRDLLAGRGVTVAVGAERVEGTAAGVDDRGRLRVRTAAGERALSAGEVTRVEHGPA
ncbi:MAG: biotin--[acetyl-CoA-carboxylase] ligase [Thermoleophilia bacterium]|nr:biotin--[acetyl-CoA-carboxylase] ligase [Thermoleophilia bacterium]